MGSGLRLLVARNHMAHNYLPDPKAVFMTSFEAAPLIERETDFLGYRNHRHFEKPEANR